METDYRYSTMVMLARADRPDPYKWHCPRCMATVAELNGFEVVAMTDTIDTSKRGLIGVRCDGRLQPTGKCRQWFMFEVTV